MVLISKILCLDLGLIGIYTVIYYTCVNLVRFNDWLHKVNRAIRYTHCDESQRFQSIDYRLDSLNKSLVELSSEYHNIKVKGKKSC